jgi:hypothetical protein
MGVNFKALITGAATSSDRYAQALFQHRMQELERKQRLAEELANKRQQGIDEGSYIPAPRVQIGSTTDKLSLLPGMVDPTKTMPSYPSTIQPQSTFRLGGEGYMPKPVRTKWEAATQGEQRAEEEFKSGLKIKENEKTRLGMSVIPEGFEITGYTADGRPVVKKIENKEEKMTKATAESQAYREAKDEADLQFGIAGFVPNDKKTEYQSYLNKRKQEIYQEKMGSVDKKTNIQTDLADPGRNKAIKFLEDNGAPITDANITAVKKKYKW